MTTVPTRSKWQWREITPMKIQVYLGVEFVTWNLFITFSSLYRRKFTKINSVKFTEISAQTYKYWVRHCGTGFYSRHVRVEKMQDTGSLCFPFLGFCSLYFLLFYLIPTCSHIEQSDLNGCNCWWAIQPKQGYKQTIIWQWVYPKESKDCHYLGRCPGRLCKTFWSRLWTTGLRKDRNPD